MSRILTVPRRRYSRTDTGAYWYAVNGGWAYGTDATTGEWVRTRDGRTLEQLGAICTDDFGAGTRPIDMMFADGYMFVVVPAAVNGSGLPSGTGKVWRATAGTFDTWTDITPTGWTTGTCGRPAVLAHTGTDLLVGAYGYYAADGSADIHRSTDNGATWQTAWNPGGATRHIHAVRTDPDTPTTVWATVGDSPGSPRGLYRSTDSGATWGIVASDQYPINFGFLSDGTFVGEGDGVQRPHIVGLAPGATSFSAEITAEMVDDAGAAWYGTTRGLIVLPGDQLFYTTTAENGNTGTRWGIWYAKPSGDTWAVTLLEETGAAWMIMSDTLRLGRDLLCYRYRFTLPRI